MDGRKELAYAVVVLPHFTADRVTRASADAGHAGPDGAAPFVTVTAERGRRVVVDTGPGVEGVRSGMTLSEARAMLPSLEAVELDPAGSARTHAWIARVCQQRFAPRAGLLGDRGVWMEIGGSTHLFGGTEPLLDGVVDLMDRLGYRVRVASGATAGEAWALAAFATPDGAATMGGDPATTLVELPVTALRLDRDTASLLGELGVRRIGELIALDRAAVSARFGPAAAKRLDEVLGRRDEKLIAVDAIGRIVASVDFAGSTDRQDAVLFGLRRLTNAFETLLAVGGLAARTVVLSLERAGEAGEAPRSTVVTLPCSTPMTTAESFFVLLRERVERVDLSDPVVSLSLEATDTTKHQPRQLRLFESADGPNERFGALRDRLAARFGDTSVRPVRFAETHIPEQRIDSDGEQTASPDPTRPSTLLSPPVVIRVTLDDLETPIAVRGPGVVGEVHSARGPERIASGWWSDAVARDYYEVALDDGRHLWIFRDLESGGWHLHGLF